MRANIAHADWISRDVGKDETAVTQPQLIDLGRAEDMSLAYGEEAIQLGVGAWERQTAGGSVRLAHRAVVPKPATGDLIIALAHHAVVADRILVVCDRRHS